MAYILKLDFELANQSTGTKYECRYLGLPVYVWGNARVALKDLAMTLSIFSINIL